MLHEILLSLSGHPSPLLRNDYSDSAASSLISPPEKQLLNTAAHLSDLHCKLREQTSLISTTHKSAICRAVATAIATTHLAAFQRRILEVEDTILSKDAALVGAYNIVPLTAVVGQFTDWTRRLEWLWELIEFIIADGGRRDKSSCRAAKLIDKLRAELQTGYPDIAETAQSLLRVAETSWLKQVSAWILYGRKPAVGGNDFFILEDAGEEQGYKIDHDLLPLFVTPSTAASMLFIGVSLNRARSKASTDLDAHGLGPLASQHQTLTQLPSPLNGVALSRAVAVIRSVLSRTTLQKLLPLTKVLDILKVLREFFLLGRGEFAIALVQQADEKIRSRWQRADNLAYEKRDTLGTVVVKEGEVAAVLTRTWAFLGSMQSQHHADEDEDLELARDLLLLRVSKSAEAATPVKGSSHVKDKTFDSIVTTPFRNLLFSVPVTLTMQIQSPLDLFLTHSDLQIYTAINSYLLSIRRAHLRLTDLWKITSLRRHHPPPPRAPYGNTKGGIAKTKLLRDRWSLRSSIMRSTWSTSSATIFFLGETEAYLQVEVVEGLWSHFHNWLTGVSEPARGGEREHQQQQQHPSKLPRVAAAEEEPRMTMDLDDDDDGDGDGDGDERTTHQPNHDPQTLGTAHRRYLGALTRRLLLTQATFTTPLYDLLVHTDHLVALVHRLQSIWTSADLEADEGVVDAFSNLEAEERDVLSQLRNVEVSLKSGVEDVVSALRALSLDPAFAAELEEGDDAGGFEDDGDDDDGDGVLGDEEGGGGVGRYRPRRVGGIDRLLMKLHFGGWFGPVSTAMAEERGYGDVHGRGGEFFS